MTDIAPLTTDDFRLWQEKASGRYELVDGLIVAHPDWRERDAEPLDAAHDALCEAVAASVRPQVRPHVTVVAASVRVDRISANVADVVVRRDAPEAAASRAIEKPRFVFEVTTAASWRLDRGRKVSDYLAIAGLEAYVIVDSPSRSLTVHRPTAGPQTVTSGSMRIARDLALDLRELFP